jgi:hypothetical protein
MVMKTISRFLVAVLFAGWTGAASATLIDFESVDPTDFGTPVLVDGFNFNIQATGWLVGDLAVGNTPGEVGNGTNILYMSGDSNGNAPNVIMTQLGGGEFDLWSFDAAESTGGGADILTVTGMLFGGGTVVQSFAVGNIFESLLLVGFEGVTSVLFQGAASGSFGEVGFELDNLNTESAVATPTPATLALLGLGLVSLGWSRRKKG